MKPGVIDKEKTPINLARYKKGGETFEIVINPEEITKYKNGKSSDIKEVVMYEKVFSDAKRGLETSPDIIERVFNTTDVKSIIKMILDHGEIQFTQEYRESKRKEKFNKILDIITRNAIDPRTGLPHPKVRIERAMEEARVRIDDLKGAEDQVNDILSALKPILPIKFAKIEVVVKIGPNHAAKAYPIVQRFGKILMDNWQNDGSWVCSVELPAGLQNDFFDELNKFTQGEVESKIVRKD